MAQCPQAFRGSDTKEREKAPLTWFGLVRSDLAWSGLVSSALVWFGFVWSPMVCFRLAQSGLTWSGLPRRSPRQCLQPRLTARRPDKAALSKRPGAGKRGFGFPRGKR